MDMSFAQALNEAKQVIVQQSNRIKADADKIRQQQQTIVDQCSIITDHEMKNKEQASDLARQAESIEALEAQVSKLTVAREQAEAVIDRQGQRLGNLQEQVTTLEKKVAEQSDSIDHLTVERDSFKTQMPSKEDEDALAAMAALLTTKKSANASKEAAKPGSQLRFNGEPRAEAA
jgi:predicted RNase H-like nuclease (RuvC/YqgF family)